MLKKSRLLRMTVLVIFLFITLFGSLTQVSVQAYSDVSNMTDQTFFGVWNGSTWTTVGKLDYTVTGMSAVETAVKSANGNYTNAKSSLLTYFKNRTTRTVLGWSDPATSNQILKAQLNADDFIFTGEEYPLGVCTFTTTEAYVSTDVTLGVNGALSGTTKLAGFMLMGRDHSNNSAIMRSREDASYKPRLVVNLTGGGQQTLYPTKDACIRAGTYGDTAYGATNELLAKDLGTTSDYTRRAYAVFDLSGINAGSIASATLEMYGYCNSGTYQVVVCSSGATGFDESTVTWNNTEGYIYSWTGESGGTDWNNPPYSQQQFATSACRLLFLNDMIPAFIATSDTNYSSNAIRLMLDFISDKGNNEPLYTQTLDGGIRALNLTNAYHYLKNSTSMDAAANTAILKYLWQAGNALADPANFHSNNNWGMYESRGLYAMSMYFPEFTATQGSSGWVQTAKTRLVGLISGLVNSDGSYIEASSGYADGSAGVYALLKDIAAVYNDSFGTIYDTKLQQLGKYIMDFSRPDGVQPGFGDSDAEGDVTYNVNNIASKYPARTDLLYFGSNGAQGSVPGHTSSIYPVGGSAFMKTGYGPNDMFMSIDLNEGTHSHPDLLSVTAYAYGRNLLVDPGVYTYGSDDESNWFRKKTLAHNTIEKNGAAQSMSTSVITSLNYFSTNSIFDFYEGDHNGYTKYDHFRDVMFIRGSYWIVSDFVAPDITTSTSYKQTWHLLPNSNISLNGTTKRATSAFSSGANIQIVPVDPSNLSASIDSGYYQTQGGYTNADYVSYAKSGISGNVTFDTVLFPTQSGDNSRNVTVNRLTTSPSVSSDVATSFRICLNNGQGGNVGYYYLSHEMTPTVTRGFDTFTFNGKAAYVETDSYNNNKLAALKNGTILTNGGADLITSPSMIKDIGVKWNGTSIDISGSQLVPDLGTGTAVKIYAPPSVTIVNLNGTSVSFVRNGNYIYAAKAVNGFNPTDDAYVRGGANSANNYAVTNELFVKKYSNPDNEKHSYLKFDFSSFTGTVTSAKLRLFTCYVGPDSTRTVKIYGTTDESWSENTITYGNAPAGSTYITSLTIGNADVNKWFQADVSSYVNGQSDKKVSFYIVNEGTSSDNSQVGFCSNDSAVNKPILVIN